MTLKDNLWFCVVVVWFSNASGQNLQLSPCPNVFQYVPNGQHFSGFVNQLVPPGNSHWRLDMKLLIVSNNPDVNDGEVKILLSENEVLNVFVRGGYLKYLVDFPSSHSIPLIKSISINNVEICKGTPERNVLRGKDQYYLYSNLNNIIQLQDGGRIRQQYNVRDKYPAKKYQIDIQQNDISLNQQINNAAPNEGTIEKNHPHRRSSGNVSTPNVINKFGSNNQICGKPVSPVALIVNGIEASQGDWPWLSAIYRKFDWDTTYQCVGSLISNKHVLTAGHCLHENEERFKENELFLKLGILDIAEWGENVIKRDVKKIYIHPKYQTSTIEHDIAILEIKPVDLNSNVMPVCLWRSKLGFESIIGKNGTVVGWGKDEDGEITAKAHQIKMPIVSPNDCYKSNPDFQTFISSYTFCAGNRDDSGPCSGDSGGGLYLRNDGSWQIRGIVSLSLGTGEENPKLMCNLRDYLIFVDVASYVEWIDSIIN